MAAKRTGSVVCGHKGDEREEIRRAIQWEMYFPEPDSHEPEYTGKVYPFLSGDEGFVDIPRSVLNGAPGALNTIFDIRTSQRREIITEGVSGSSSWSDVGYNARNLGRVVKRDGDFLVLAAISDD